MPKSTDKKTLIKKIYRFTLLINKVKFVFANFVQEYQSLIETEDKLSLSTCQKSKIFEHLRNFQFPRPQYRSGIHGI